MINRKRFVVGQRGDTGPRLLCGCAQQFEDPFQLVVDIRSGKQGTTSVRQLGKDASS